MTVYIVYYVKDCESYGKRISVFKGDVVNDIIREMLPEEAQIHSIEKIS